MYGKLSAYLLPFGEERGAISAGIDETESVVPFSLSITFRIENSSSPLKGDVK
jgi:hypothetical protein